MRPPHWLVALSVLYVWRGRLDEAIEAYTADLALQSRNVLAQTNLATALYQQGKIDEAVSITNELISVIERMPRNSNAETDIYRLRGDLLLMEGPSHQEQATGYYQRAIETARVNRDKIAELEAITRLARLLDREGRRDEARAMLAEIYNWFTEGFDTADLIEAKALLEELGGTGA